MQFEEFDNKVRQAADHHHPAYDQDAWAKMEKLLDKHMPEDKEKKRRFIFFLLFFLLLGGGAWLVINKPWKQGTKLSETNTVISGNNKTELPNKNQQEVEVKNSVAFDEPYHPIVPDIKTSETPTNKLSILLPVNSGNKEITALSVQKNNPKNRSKTPAITPDETIYAPVAPDVAKNEITSKNTNTIVDNNLTKPNSITQPSSETQKPSAKTEEKKDVIKNEDPVKATEPDLAVNEQKKDKQKTKTKKANTFFLSLSAGPDISFVGNSKPGTIKLITGGGIGFTLHDRITFRTGFYTGRKVYTAAPEDYDPPASFWTYYPYLQKVNADCKVYEIPVSVSYNFGKKENHNWYAGAGVSSLLMKRETYNYFYKYNPTSPVYSKKYTIRNRNEHYFSVLTLSAGYQRTIGKHISISAEPYFKIPLTGIGLGKVKLNSSGVMFTVAVNPFSFKKSPTKNSH